MHDYGDAGHRRRGGGRGRAVCGGAGGDAAAGGGGDRRRHLHPRHLRNRPAGPPHPQELGGRRGPRAARRRQALRHRHRERHRRLQRRGLPRRQPNGERGHLARGVPCAGGRPHRRPPRPIRGAPARDPRLDARLPCRDARLAPHRRGRVVEPWGGGGRDHRRVHARRDPDEPVLRLPRRAVQAGRLCRRRPPLRHRQRLCHRQRRRDTLLAAERRDLARRSHPAAPLCERARAHADPRRDHPPHARQLDLEALRPFHRRIGRLRPLPAGLLHAPLRLVLCERRADGLDRRRVGARRGGGAPS